MDNSNSINNPGTSAREVESFENDLTKLLAAAVVNRGFRELLLSQPAKALAVGYRGEEFQLDQDDRELILTCSARTLPDLATLLTNRIKD